MPVVALAAQHLALLYARIVYKHFRIVRRIGQGEDHAGCIVTSCALSRTAVRRIERLT